MSRAPTTHPHTLAFSPERPRLADALAATFGLSFPDDAPIRREDHPDHVAHYVDLVDAFDFEHLIDRSAGEAWESLVARGTIPACWAADPDRRFEIECRRCFGEGDPSGYYCKPCWGHGAVECVRVHCGDCTRVEYALAGELNALRCAGCHASGVALNKEPSPPTLAFCATLGSDPEGVEAAEALAAEATAALYPDADSDLARRRFWLVATSADLHARCQRFARRPLLARGQNAFPDDHAVARATARLTLAVRRGARFFDAYCAELAREERWRRALDPLRAILARGYAFERADPSGVTLLAARL